MSYSWCVVIAPALPPRAWIFPLEVATAPHSETGTGRGFFETQTPRETEGGGCCGSGSRGHFRATTTATTAAASPTSAMAAGRPFMRRDASPLRVGLQSDEGS